MQAQRQLGEALEQHAARWVDAVDRARRKVDAEAVKRLEALRTVLEDRQALAGTAIWLAALEHGDDLARIMRKGPPAAASPVGDSRNANRRLTVEELLEGVEAYIAASTLEREPVAGAAM